MRRELGLWRRRLPWGVVTFNRRFSRRPVAPTTGELRTSWMGWMMSKTRNSTLGTTLPSNHKEDTSHIAPYASKFRTKNSSAADCCLAGGGIWWRHLECVHSLTVPPPKLDSTTFENLCTTSLTTIHLQLPSNTTAKLNLLVNQPTSKVRLTHERVCNNTPNKLFSHTNNKTHPLNCN